MSTEQMQKKQESSATYTIKDKDGHIVYDNADRKFMREFMDHHTGYTVSKND